jgi:hypothetical protein
MTERPEPDSAWTYEQLLDGAPPQDAVQAAAADWVAAVRSPATGAELDGLEAAVTAFTTAGPGLAPASRREARPGRHLRGWVLPLPAGRMARVAVLTAAGAVLLAGTAAAATGSLPTTLQRAAHVLGAPAPDQDRTVDAVSSHPAEPTGSAAASPGSRPSDETEPSPTAKPTARGVTDEALAGLCRAFTAGGLSTTSAAYRALVERSGARGVPALCADLEREHPGAGPSSKGRPSNPPQPSPGPDDHGNPNQPTDLPTDHSSQASHSHSARVPAPPAPTDVPRMDLH